MRFGFLICICIVLGACNPFHEKNEASQSSKRTVGEGFQENYEFLQKQTKTILLKDSTSDAALVIAPLWQGRVMMSAGSLDTGLSLGWINHDYIEKHLHDPHANVYGGSDRIWIGPEGSTNSFYFEPGDSLTYSYWHVPPALDTAVYDLVYQSKQEVSFRKEFQLLNYKQNVFDFRIDRSIQLLARRDIMNYIGTEIPKQVRAVAFQSRNTITNIGNHKWDTGFGMPNIRVLGMFPSSKNHIILIPKKAGASLKHNPQYVFDKKRIADKKTHWLVSGNSNLPMQVGLRQNQTYNYIGTYDPQTSVLTIIQFTLPSRPMRYVSSEWSVEATLSEGTAISVYTDGPSASKPQTGHYIEIESTSPAASLKPKEKLTHYHRTFHFVGRPHRLDPIVQHVFGMKLSEWTL